MKDVKLIQSLGVRESGLLASISDFHVFHKFQPGGRMPAAKIYLDAVQLAFDAGIRPRLHLEDASRASIDFIRYFVGAVLEMAALYPDSQRPKFRICDTLGVALPDDDVPLPRGVPQLFQTLRAEGLRPSDLEFHLEVSLTKDSGIAGLIFVARQHLHREFGKEDPNIRTAHEGMLHRFDEGRQTAVEWEEIASFLVTQR